MVRTVARRTAIVSLLIALGLLSFCNRTEPGSCEYWLKKLGSETDEKGAIEALSNQKCNGADEKLAERLGTTRFPVDVLTALRKQGPTDASLRAVREALKSDAAADAAVATLLEWSDEGSLADVKAALLLPDVAARREALLKGALTLAGNDADALRAELAELVAGDPGKQGIAVNRLAASLLSKTHLSELSDDQRKQISGALARAMLLPQVATEVEVAEQVRAAIGRVGLVDPTPLVEAIAAENVANEPVARVLWDTGDPRATVAIVRHLLKVLGSEAQALPKDLMLTATVAAVTTPTEGVVASLTAALREGGRAASTAASILALIGSTEAREALWKRFEVEKGESRAELVSHLAMALGPDDTERFTTEMEKSASVLVRDAAKAAGPSEMLMIVKACGARRECYVTRLQKAQAQLGGLGGALAEARKELDQKKGEADARLDEQVEAFRARQGDSGTPEATAALRAEMERLRALRDAEYSALAPLTKRLDDLQSLEARVVKSLRMLDLLAATGDDAVDAVVATLGNAKGPSLAQLRLLAVAFLERNVPADKRAALEKTPGLDPQSDAAIHLRAVLAR